MALWAVALPHAVGDDAATAEPLWRIEHREGDATHTTLGRRLLQARDGGLLLETPDSRLVTVTPAQLISAAETGETFQRRTADELAAQLLSELGPDFSIVKTRRYVIATNASDVYGEWCGRLFERLQTAFLAYWKRAGLDVAEPDYPLVAIILESPEQYAAFAAQEAGGAIAGSLGFYSVRTNRIVLANLLHGTAGASRLRDAELSQRLESQQANVATLVHEATHQIAFNSGLHQRYADNPMWLTEGLAMFCEAPDLRGLSGWRTIGRVHAGRLQHYREFAVARRKPDSLRSLIASEDRFRDPAAALDAYAESWALTYFLIQTRRPKYVEYLRGLAAKPRLVWDDPSERERAFTAAFGADWEALEREFEQSLRRVRAP